MIDLTTSTTIEAALASDQTPAMQAGDQSVRVFTLQPGRVELQLRSNGRELNYGKGCRYSKTTTRRYIEASLTLEQLDDVIANLQAARSHLVK